jgi:hypothetical protein
MKVFMQKNQIMAARVFIKTGNKRKTSFLCHLGHVASITPRLVSIKSAFSEQSCCSLHIAATRSAL